MSKLLPGHCLLAGAPVEEALRAFQENVNQRETIFSTDHWLLPKLERLRQLLANPITAGQAAALRDVLYGRRFMKDLIGWLESPGIGWEHYPIYKDFLEEKQQIEREEEEERFRAQLPPLFECEDSEKIAREYRERSKREYLPKARPCPHCGTLPQFLEWYYTPPPPRHVRSGCCGWHTRCKSCGVDIDFFATMHWTRGPLHVCRGPSNAIH